MKAEIRYRQCVSYSVEVDLDGLAAAVRQDGDDPSWIPSEESLRESKAVTLGITPGWSLASFLENRSVELDAEAIEEIEIRPL
jgi:hypothetical protein